MALGWRIFGFPVFIRPSSFGLPTLPLFCLKSVVATKVVAELLQILLLSGEYKRDHRDEKNQTLVRVYSSSIQAKEKMKQVKYSLIFTLVLRSIEILLFFTTIMTNETFKNMYMYLIGLFQLLVFLALFATCLAADAPSYPAPGPKPAYPAEVPYYFLRFTY